MNKALTEGYSVKLTLKTINPQEFMTLAMQACRQLGWQLVGTAEHAMLFYTNGSATSQQEEITIHTEEDRAFVRSRSVSEYLYDPQQNVQNIRAFRSALSIHHNNFLQKKYPYNRLKVQTAAPDFDFQAGWGAIVPSKHYIITPLLIYINVFILLAMILTGISPMDPKASALLGWGGNFQPFVVKGEYWRLFSYMFLHGGVLHLAGNIFALLYAGLYLEPMLGKLRYISAYVLTGILAGVVSMLMHDNSVGVGASGAIFGLYGVFLALLSARYIKGAIRSTLLRSLLFFIVYNLLMGLQGNTDNAAHVGGLLSGVVIGYAYLGGLKKLAAFNIQIATVVILSILVLTVTAGVVLLLKAG